ncbi:MAG: hypothetical protein R2813_05320 [Flavobacteriales bacterium]
MRINLYILSTLLLLSLSSIAQTFREFSGQEKFISDLRAQIEEKSVGDAKKEHKKMLDKFEEMWVELQSFTPSQQNTIYKTSDELLKNKLKIFPDVRDYIETVIIVVESGKSQEEFFEWHRTVDFLIGTRTAKKEFSPYMQFSQRLFGEGIIYATGSVEWHSNNAQYEFGIEKDQPKLTFKDIDLECRAKGSNSTIIGTSGVLYALDGEWIGKNGTVTWERAGLNPNKVYAIINDYDIRLKFASFHADSVTFYNTDYFDQPLTGRLLDKVQAENSEDRSSYPEFVSYSKRLRIANIDKGVDYEGGFTQKGSRFLASGSEEDPAYLTFYLDNKVFLEVSSLSFSIKEDRIISTDAAVKFMLHEDSITHPGLDFKFIRDERKVTLIRLDEGLQKAPYFDSYHAIDIYSEYVTWKIDQPKIKFGTIPNSTDNRAFFESDYYFRENRFDQLQGMSMNHPLVLIKNCFAQMGTDYLYDYEVAKCLKTDKTNAMVLLLEYTNLGLVKYDPRTGLAKSTPRLFHYIAAKSENEDYDVIQIASDIGNMDNAEMDLVDEVYTLKINGIRNITLSDSHQVVLYPKQGTITMKKNRDFDFSGVVKAGRLEFFGSNYAFLYDDFKIEMPNVDSVRMTVTTGKETTSGRQRLRRVSTVIEEVKGTLEIDKSENKSGLEQLEEYPIFTSHEKSRAYYQRGTIQKGAYKRENFHFELDPFVFDSLDHFENERLKFQGTFKSADVFPEFKETLTLQEDYSMGFIRNTPKEGFPIYRGKGTYRDTIKLSHQGLRGSGRLQYLTSLTKSDDFLFLPEEMQTVSTSFVIEEQMSPIQYPPTASKESKQVWKPYDDIMQCKSGKNQPFQMYDGSNLTGNLDLTPDELSGGGLFVFEKAELESRLFHFKFSEFDSDTADFRLKSEVSAFDGFDFKTNNFKTHIDFAKRRGDFVSNDGTSMIDFGSIKYVAFMDRFTWYMDEEAIELSGQKAGKQAAGTMQFEGSRFVSIHPDQDSLEFYSPAARYDIRNVRIDAKQVEFIPVADALIYPDSGLVTLFKNAKMKTLTNCGIVANSITRYHKIDSATIDIYAKRNYNGTGLYTYKDVAGNKQQIRFFTVGVDSSFQTYAKGEISEQRGFTLSPYFDYKGDVRLEASTKDLSFDGYSRIKHQCEAAIPMPWFKFNAPIDPEDIYIPIGSKTMDEEDNLLSSAIVLDPDTGAIYTSFISPKLSDKDIELLPAEGYLFYHEGSKEYRISNINKLTQQSLPGQYLSLNSEECKAFAEGKLGFGINPGQVKLSTVGNINQDIKTGMVKLDVMILVDFFFEDKLIDDMGKIMAENAIGDPVDFERETYQRGLRELMGANEADKLISAITLTGTFKRFPSELEKHMFLTDVQLKWNPETSSYQSVGKIGIGNIGKRQVNVKVNGKVEVVTGKNPEINIYLEADKDTWYYFKYNRNIMAAYSSLDDFNSTLGELKADKRKLKVERGQSPYSFMVGSKRRRDEFISKF